MQRAFSKMVMFVASLVLAVLAASARGGFSPPQPIPFHAPQPQFSFQGPAKEGTASHHRAIPSGFFLPPPPPGGQGDRTHLFSAPSVQRPPPPLPSLPWEAPQRTQGGDPFAQRDLFASFFEPRTQQQPPPPPPSKPQVFAPAHHAQQQSQKSKLVKGGTAYPKKWIPAPADGKKVKPKNVEKHRQQLVVLSSTTNKELRGDEVQSAEELPHARADDVLRTHPRRTQPHGSAAANGKHAFEPLPVEARQAPRRPSAPSAPEDFVKADESQDVAREPKPYAFNHQQEASGSGFTPLFAAEAAGSQHGFVGHETAHPISGGSGDRVAFHIHGEKGPKSYRFGYDTGKGPDRHFRYEQRDDDGNVKGHYGFYDKHGKLQVVHYSADPKNGFSADGGNFGKHEVL